MAPSTVNTVTLFFALLSLVSAGIALLVLASVLTGNRARVANMLQPIALELAAAIATTAMIGSLILSESAGFAPCLNCWIQRGFMYPASFLLIGAVLTKKEILAKAGGLLALLGLPVSIYHRIEQSTGKEIGGFCDEAVSCTYKYVNQFGFMTIPTMAGCGFVGIVALVAVSTFKDRASATPVEAEDRESVLH